MRKLTVVLLAALIMVAGTAYLISMTGADKAEQQALKGDLLAFKKALLGSYGLDVDGPDKVARVRGMGRLRVINALTVGEGEGCPPCESYVFPFTLAPDEEDVYCLACCEDQFIKLDVFSERIGAPTDVALEVLNSEDEVIFADDDGRGLSGVSTDSCLIFKCPDTGEYSVRVTNLIDPNTPYTEDESVYRLELDVLCEVEEEPNDPGTPGDLNCEGFGGADEDEDEDGDDGNELDEDEDEDEDIGGFVVGEYGGTEEDVDCFTVCLRPGEILFVGIDSAECDDISDDDQVDPILTLEDDQGNPVAFDDDTDDLDPNLTYRAPDLGNDYDTYTLCLADARLTNPGVYELKWTIMPEIITDDLNCALVGDDEDEDEDEDSDDDKRD